MTRFDRLEKLRKYIWAAGLSALLIVVLLIVVMASGSVFMTAAHAQVVGSVVVQGNQRVDQETILARSTLKSGRRYSETAADETLKALFETGMFEDVRVSRRGATVVIVVRENPLVYKVNFEGNSKIEDKILESIVSAKASRPLPRGALSLDVERIKELYKARGRFAAHVEARRIARPGNRVEVVYKVTEGKKTGVKSINFIGNKAFSSYRLRRVIDTREGGLLSWFTQSDIYSEERLELDKDKLRRFYIDRGYVDFEVVAADARFDAKRQGFLMTFRVNEGARYKFGEINVVTSLPDIDIKSLRSIILSKSGDVYNAEQVEKSIENIAYTLSKKGYAFAKVRPQGQRDYARHTIALTYLVDEGERAYIERINIIGNNRTRDYVIRREFELAEGDPYNQALIERARRNLSGLQYFKAVDVTPRAGSAPDKIILDVKVTEIATGSISVSANYSTAEKLGGTLSIAERNLLGRGQAVSASIGGGRSNREALLSFTEPRLFGSRISGGVSVFYRNLRKSSFRAFDSKTVGGTIRFGLPLRDDLNFSVHYTGYNQENKIPANQANVSPALKSAQGKNFVSIVGYSLNYNTLDDFLAPSKGIYADFSQDVAGVGGDVKFLRTTLDSRLYQELIPTLGVVGMLRAQAGHMIGWGGNKVRVYDSFFPGVDLVRGFTPSGIGPRDKTTEDALGATIYYGGTAELIFPIWGLPEELGLRGALFADAGGAFKPGNLIGLKTDDYYNDKALRASVGLSVLWRSPFGPLRVDFGFPVKKQKYDEKSVFNLSLGVAF